MFECLISSSGFSNTEIVFQCRVSSERRNINSTRIMSQRKSRLRHEDKKKKENA